MGERLSVEQFDCEDENLVEEYQEFKGGKNRPMSVSVRNSLIMIPKFKRFTLITRSSQKG